MREPFVQYIDPMLPFGLHSSAKIFNAVADALEWRLKAVYVYHYLDDFTVLGAPGTDEFSRAVSKLHITYSKLGIPLATHKSEGPATSITFLRIVIDTVAEELRLPAEKLDRLRTLLVKWGDKKVYTCRDLESLIGHLNHACKVVRPGRSFLRRMIDLLHHRKNVHYIHLSRGFQSDLQWWKVFAATWNGTSYLASNTTAQFASGASGAWHGTSWFQWRWGGRSRDLAITVKELLPIVPAALIWGPAWHSQTVLSYCDNQAVVAILRSWTCKQPGLMHMLRCLTWTVGNSYIRVLRLLPSRRAVGRNRDRIRASPAPQPGGRRYINDRSAATMMKFHLRKSKCDQFGTGADILVGRSGCQLCPVAAILAYMKERGGHPGAFFIDDNRVPITKGKFVARVRDALRSAGYPEEQFAGHSFRIGAATTAAMAGIEDSTIQTLGRWHSAAFLRYIRTPHDWLAAITASLAKSNPQ